MKRILLLEDDPGLADGLSYSLEKNGFCVDTAGSISCAKEYISKNKNTYSLLILDVMLPDGTGFEICEYMRRCGDSVPIIFLTASDEEINVIRGLDCRFPLKLYNLRRHHDRPRKELRFRKRFIYGDDKLRIPAAVLFGP